ncbi:MAG: hypothetical protein AABW47_02470 [Nanoarchaeota archaeon]
MNNKRGNLIMSNVLSLLLNLIVLIAWIGFISSRGTEAIVLEQNYAKNIVLLIDSAKPITEMTLNMKDAFDLAKKNGVPFNETVRINGNNVIVKLSFGGGYKYSFFNDVDVTVYPDLLPNKNYIIKVNGYN